MKTLFKNAKVWLSGMNFTDSVGFDSVSGKIIFTGNSDEAEKIKNEFNELMDLNKKLVLPGLCDGHCHFITGAYVNSLLNLREARSKKDFVDGIMAFGKDNFGWIEGGFFSEANFKEKINLSKEFLDEIINDIPVFISRFDCHSAFANSKAIELSGIADKTNEFTEDEVIKNNTGELTGEFKERARDYILECIPEPSIEIRTAAAIKQMKEFNGFGITSISDITLVDDLKVYRKMLDDNKLLLKTDSRLPFKEYLNAEKYKKDFEDHKSMIQFNSFKAFYDGTLSSKTAYMHDNFKNTEHNGIRTEHINSGEFIKEAFEIDKPGYQMSVHAIGDKAVTELLDLNEELIKNNGKRDRRFRIEHAQHISKNDFKRFKELEVLASVQPAHLFSDAKTAKEILNDYKLEHNYKKLIDIGATVCFGTDFPIVSEDPFENIFYAMERKVQGFENGFVNENNFTINECLEAYTFKNAYATFNENERGRIASGMDADIIVMENDLFTIPADEVKEATVKEVYFRGSRIV